MSGKNCSLTLVLSLFSITCVTWNINGRDVGEDMKLTLPSEPADLIVIGFQEADRSAEAYMSNNNLRKDGLEVKIAEAIDFVYGETTKYKMVASRMLVGLFVIVFAKEELHKNISHISVSSVACGMMGVVGNKGAVAVRLKLFNSYLCFINCHLAAHANQVNRRNQDFADIHRRMQFATQLTGAETKQDILADSYLDFKRIVGIDDCDVLMWLGDLNYRVDMESRLARIFVEEKQLEVLLEKDQLSKEKAKCGLLSKYQEAPITFAPSYYFDIGTDQYDTSEKQRVPSWCDRILWRENDQVEAKVYDCVFEARSSDHKPVRLLSTAQVSQIDGEKFEQVFQEVLKELDIFENAAIPDTEVDSNSVAVENVPYFQVATASFRLRNKGKVFAPFRFVAPGGDTNVRSHPTWIRISPDHGLIKPGQSADINILFIYDNDIARKAINPDQIFESILVLHIEGGKDHFVRKICRFALIILDFCINNMSPNRFW